eukprot:8247809-Karenia_brevis.AAC.1
MNINVEGEHVLNPMQQPLQSKGSLKYLGASLMADGKAESELAQKIGTASHDFRTLCQIWNHSSISKSFKFTIFQACVIQKLLYSLETVWLNKVLQVKLNGFYCKCLRRILGIAPSHISRVSNAYILNQFLTQRLDTILLKRQLKLFGEIARSSEDSMMRISVFEPNTFNIRTIGTRRRGRPRNTWGLQLHKMASQIANIHGMSLNQILTNKSSWENAIKSL